MLKITEGPSTNGTARLYLEGQINGPWLEEIKRCCDRALSTAGRLTLDLSNVSFVDRDALILFRELTNRDVTITNCSPFVAEQLREIEHSSRFETPDQKS